MHRREGKQVDAVDHSASRKRRTGGGGQRRQDVDELRRLRDALPGSNPRWPADEERCPYSAFEEGAFPSAVWLVDVVEPGIPGAAIIVGEDDDRVLVDPLRLERSHYLADAAVERADHRSIDAEARVPDRR